MLLSTSCAKHVINSEEADNPHSSLRGVQFSDTIELAEFSKVDKTIDYQFARKLAIADIVVNKSYEKYNWDDCKLSEAPIAIYGFDNVPMFYDFIVLDKDDNGVGVVSTYARKDNTKPIYRVSTDIYKFSTTKKSNLKFYADRNGSQYTGAATKSNEAIGMVSNVNTGENFIPQNGYMTDEQILQYMKTNVIPQLYSNPQDAVIAADSMEQRMLQSQEDARRFWSEMNKISEDVNAISGDENLADTDANIPVFYAEGGGNDENDNLPDPDGTGGGGGGGGQPAFPPYLEKYQNARFYTPTGNNNCGQWICGLILYANEYGYYNPGSDIGGGPMSVEKMDYEIRKRSNNVVGTSNVGRSKWDCYWHIRERHAAVRLLVNWNGIHWNDNGDYEGTQWHWTLMYGGYRIERFLTTSFYFLQMDNGSLVGWDHRYNRNPNDYANYTELQWFDTLFYVRD